MKNVFKFSVILVFKISLLVNLKVLQSIVGRISPVSLKTFQKFQQKFPNIDKFYTKLRKNFP